jgi:hypothetical protein
MEAVREELGSGPSLQYMSNMNPEAEFVDEIQTKV